MDRHDLDALAATSPANITYFTGYCCWIDKLRTGHAYRAIACGPTRCAYS